MVVSSIQFGSFLLLICTILPIRAVPDHVVSVAPIVYRRGIPCTAVDDGFCERGILDGVRDILLGPSSARHLTLYFVTEDNGAHAGVVAIMHPLGADGA